MIIIFIVTINTMTISTINTIFTIIFVIILIIISISTTTTNLSSIWHCCHHQDHIHNQNQVSNGRKRIIPQATHICLTRPRPAHARQRPLDPRPRGDRRRPPYNVAAVPSASRVPASEGRADVPSVASVAPHSLALAAIVCKSYMELMLPC